jgi:hypothetical protein
MSGVVSPIGITHHRDDRTPCSLRVLCYRARTRHFVSVTDRAAQLVIDAAAITAAPESGSR